MVSQDDLQGKIPLFSLTSESIWACSLLLSVEAPFSALIREKNLTQIFRCAILSFFLLIKTPKGPRIEKIQSRLIFSISLENFNPD